MKVFKFGGALLTDASAVQKLAALVQAEKTQPLVIVVSAIGRTTQALENLVAQKGRGYQAGVQACYYFHKTLVDTLFPGVCSPAHAALNHWKAALLTLLAPVETHAVEATYAAIVSLGEIVASQIVYYYLQKQGIACQWLDARDYIKTYRYFRNAQLDWKATQRLVRDGLMPCLQQNKRVLTQGFISSNHQGATTTLGKEGSDFTSAIIAAALGASSLTIWKDVPGIMNADPKRAPQAIHLAHMTYATVAQMAFYGANVLHPKTIQPLAAHAIPLYIKPFAAPEQSGTVITSAHTLGKETGYRKEIGYQQPKPLPIYLLQENQHFVQCSMPAGLCLHTEHLSLLADQLKKWNLTVTLVARSAHTFSFCVSNDCDIKALLVAGDRLYEICHYFPVSLLTVMHPTTFITFPVASKTNRLLEQRSPTLYQVVFQQEPTHRFDLGTFMVTQGTL